MRPSRRPRRRSGGLFIREDAVAGEKPHAFGRLEGKSGAAALRRMDDKLRMLPIFELGGADLDKADGTPALTGVRRQERRALDSAVNPVTNRFLQRSRRFFASFAGDEGSGMNAFGRTKWPRASLGLPCF
jgi:hypothetical protein